MGRVQLQFKKPFVAERERSFLFLAPHYPVKPLEDKPEYINVVVHFNGSSKTRC